MNLKLHGKRAFITGGTHGIGRAIAHALADEGCHIIICSRNLNRINNTKFEIISKEVQCLALQADLLLPDARARVINEINLAKWDIDILVNNVGGGGRWGQENILETSRNVWDEVYAKNVDTTIDFTLAFLPGMLSKQWGRVISITSIYGSQIGSRPWYNSAKFAQSAIMKNFSRKPEFVRKGVTFNMVAPGPILIPDTGWEEEKNKHPEEYFEKLQHLPMGHLGEPEDVALAVAFLCSDAAKHVNGAVIPVDGGEST